MQRIQTHQFAQLEEIRYPAGFLQRLIQIIGASGNLHVFPVFFAQLANLSDRRFQARRGARHSAIVPHDFSQPAVEPIHGAASLNSEQPRGQLRHAGLGARKCRVAGVNFV